MGFHCSMTGIWHTDQRCSWPENLSFTSVNSHHKKKPRITILKIECLLRHFLAHHLPSYSHCTVLKFVVAHTDLTSQFRQIFGCALRFAQFLALLHMAPISSKTTVPQSASKPIYVNLQLHALFYTIFSFLTQGTNFKESNAYAECFDANFKQEYSCARSLAQVLAFQKYGQIGSKNDSCPV